MYYSVFSFSSKKPYSVALSLPYYKDFDVYCMHYLLNFQKVNSSLYYINKVSLCFFFCLTFLHISAQSNRNNEINEGQSVKYKALFLYQFIEKATWPNMNPSVNFRVGIMNNSELFEEFKSYAQAKNVNGGNFEVVRISDLDKVTSFHMVYVNNQMQYPIESIYRKIGSSPVLVVTSEYRDDECMINFVAKGNRIKFTLNEEEIEKQKIIVSLELKKISIQTYSKISYPRDPYSTFNRHPKSLDEINKRETTKKLNDKEFDKVVSELKNELDSEIKKVNKKETEISSLKTNITDLESSVEEKQTNIEQVEEKIEYQSIELERLADSILKTKAEYQKNIAKVEESEMNLLNATENLEKTQMQLNTSVKTLNQQKIIIYLIIAILLVIGAIGVIGYKNYKKQKAQAAEISKQKNLAEKHRDEVIHQHSQLEEKTKEITDSINYAKRIQNAILPPLNLVSEKLKNCFIVYEPKDIVAGDFYWMEAKEDLVLFAAADCTGHGVPGAMVSVMCSNALNRAVKEYGLVQPAAILDKTLEIILAQFENSVDDVKDGMDIAICAFQPSTKRLEYSGAQNPLWIIRNNGLELEEIKGDKQPIGKYSTRKQFTNHSLVLDSGDLVYLSSDGYADQFGGERGKKFKSINFKKLLFEIRTKTMLEQKQLLQETFQKWKGDLEQLDDVCVLGFKA